MDPITKLPLNDTIAVAIAKMIDDSQIVPKREPSHYDIECEFNRSGLSNADPKQAGKVVGKAKRVRAVLTWSIDNNLIAGEKLVYLLLTLVKSVGGFRKESPNFVGIEGIENLKVAFKSEGYQLFSDGSISSLVLDNLRNIEKHKVLRTYAERAIKGADDAALLVGTSKDLMEAVSAFILQSKLGHYSNQTNFPTLLGQAFITLGLATSEEVPKPNEPAQKRVERALYELACSINKLRNKEGTGHGRPFLSMVSEDEAKMAIKSMGLISEYLLSKLEETE
ncbi:Abortive infection C-terminus [Anaerosphaera aminiphila DSM 21120]|uniref:Abortive infection C-terminus n=1 Tax=Anaerosphaera aminiphila DSM 21120 TaxID=1120995 RepID=A0A1M5PLS3_9FIRM|nr:Abortive infection C-terminus [Anaerosphaera aminiphila DSM 21120]